MTKVMKDMKNLQNQIGRKLNMKKTFSNHRGSLLEGERLILISVNEQKQEARVTDPFGIDWIVPLEFINTYI